MEVVPTRGLINFGYETGIERSINEFHVPPFTYTHLELWKIKPFERQKALGYVTVYKSFLLATVSSKKRAMFSERRSTKSSEL